MELKYPQQYVVIIFDSYIFPRYSNVLLTILIPKKVSVDSGPAEKMRRRMKKQIDVIIDLDVGM